MSSGRQLAVLGGNVDELGAGETLRGAALVGVDVRRGRADDRLVRREDRLQRDDVGSRTAVGEQHLGVVRGQERARAPDGALRPRISPVGGGASVIGGEDRLKDGRVRAGDVVAGEGVNGSNERHAPTIDANRNPKSTQ